MNIEIPQQLQQQIRDRFETPTNHPLSDKEVFEIFFNLRGFGHVLLKMKKEVDQSGKQPLQNERPL